MDIGATIKNFRVQKGMSQGDIEKRTGLLRCYLSRVENGHTVPSLDTLAKIAEAMDLPIARFFEEETGEHVIEKQMTRLTDDTVKFLKQVNKYSVGLNDSDKKILLTMVKRFAANAGGK
ncbi:MAG: helix-turn-helix transcriptional regulator [Acidobacteriales bacterium]|nr:helix-turn-helix transcriptional regulator [Terriglobales bacterium]